jgi:UDP-glucose 4-epimerase
MRVLVTGGAGFIGSHVVRELLARGARVVVLDSLVSGSAQAVPEEAELITADIRDAESVARALEGITHVVHLAALVSVPESMRDPVGTHDVNVSGALIVFDEARKKGVKRVVYASSAAVYGDDPSLPKSERSVLAPLSPYALSKLENEEIARLYGSAYGISSAGLRFFNVYGPGQKGDHPYASVVPRWVEAVRAGLPLAIFGDGSQTRDFIHVRDVARAVADALEKELPKSVVLNVASGTETPLKELVELIRRVCAGVVETTVQPARPGDIMRSVADAGLARELLGFVPKVSLEEGIKELFT